MTDMTTDIPIRRYFEIRIFELAAMFRHKQNTFSARIVVSNRITYEISRIKTKKDILVLINVKSKG
jgi:hypothetical protein